MIALTLGPRFPDLWNRGGLKSLGPGCYGIYQLPVLLKSFTQTPSLPLRTEARAWSFPPRPLPSPPSLEPYSPSLPLESLVYLLVEVGMGAGVCMSQKLPSASDIMDLELVFWDAPIPAPGYIILVSSQSFYSLPTLISFWSRKPKCLLGHLLLYS